MKLMTGELRSKAMRATPARHEAARLMYLPNRKGTLKRDNDYRQKVSFAAIFAFLLDTNSERSAPSRQVVEVAF